MLLCKNNDLSYNSRTNEWIKVKLMHRVDIDAILMVIKSQGHKVKGQGQKCSYMKKFGKYLIFIQLIHMMDLNATFKVTLGKVHKVKGQGQ